MHWLRALCGLLFFSLAPAQAHAQLTPFNGYWRGNAIGEVSKGVEEQLKCTSNNSLEAAGSALKIILRCANASGVSLHIHARFANANGVLSGTWEERTYNVAGSVRGSASELHLNAEVTSDTFNARVTVHRKDAFRTLP